MRVNPSLATVRSPYPDETGAYEELVAVPALQLDVGLCHANRADASGNGQLLGPDPFFDDLFLMAARRRFLSTEQLVETPEFAAHGPLQTLRINRMMVDGVVVAKGGAHFTACEPDYGRDEVFQREYAASAASPEAFAAFRARYIDVGNHEAYERAVAAAREAGK
jgi:glutaconate CoA-transferase subunit A